MTAGTMKGAAMSVLGIVLLLPVCHSASPITAGICPVLSAQRNLRIGFVSF